MRKVLAVMNKELYSYFRSPVAYIILLITLSVFNVFFFLIIEHNHEATLRDVYKIMEFMFVFIVPLLTMKLFALEKEAGTLEFLMTTPTGNTAIVAGKYLGSLVFLTLMMSIIGVYYLIIELFADPDRMTVLTGAFGVWLEGAFFLSVCLMTSTWSRSQIVAALSGYIILFFLYFSSTFLKYVRGTLEAVLQYAGTMNHVDNFIGGLITLTDTTYYVSGILMCLIIARLCIENRLWR